MSAAKRLVECPKCSGSGYIRAFSGIANGVCFRCEGTGKVKAGTAKPVKPLSEYQVKTIETIKSADLSTMNGRQLLALRDFAHWPFPQEPNLLAIWFERGESHFQAAQQRRLDHFHATRGW